MPFMLKLLIECSECLDEIIDYHSKKNPFLIDLEKVLIIQEKLTVTLSVNLHNLFLKNGYVNYYC
jgi:hypothetical protein